MKKQFLRVKQIADQTFLRAEKSDVLTEDLLTAERRVDAIKASCQATQKKITACQIDFGSETSIEKRLRKIPQVLLGASMLESSSSFLKNSILGDTLRECASVQTRMGGELLEYCTEVEKCVLRPVSGVLDNEVHNINKLRKQLGKLVLDMDSARTRFQTAERHSLQQSSNNNFSAVGKVDNLKEEMEEASQKVEQCRDALATEMFSLIGKEPHLSRLFLQLHQLQAAYHRNALVALESSLPMLENLINNFSQKPVYGCSLEEHLRVTEREVAQVIESSVSFLLEYGILEEGLLRVAGSASKMKKLKSAFDAGIELDMEEYVRDPHAVAGAFKSYLRELPDPLLTNVLYNDWMSAAKQTDFDSKLQSLWQVLHRLPPANFRNLKFVVKFLAKLQENMDINKMSSQNIAIVMAPNLIWSPTEESTTIGINMSTASLHTSIVDMLISYADWFFPVSEETENAPPYPTSSAIPNMNDPRGDLFDKEVNGNSMDVLNSPRSPQNKNFRKPAAPPPPAQRSLDPGPLINLLGENLDPDIVRKVNSSIHTTSRDISMPSAPLQKEHSDSGANELVSHRDKPAVPEKPNYSSCSLDRKSLRQHPHRLTRPPSDSMSRSSHVERPSVPPPERPDKVAKSSSQENLANEAENPRTRTEADPPTEKVPASTVTNTSSEIAMANPGIAARPEGELQPKKMSDPETNKAIKAEPPSIKMPEGNKGQEIHKPPHEVNKHVEVEGPSPATVQRSRSASKMNRFDFLVNQREERPPPERPPRSMDVVSAQNSTEEPVSPKMVEVERAKPPRPQPPAKPKLNLQTENTNL